VPKINFSVVTELSSVMLGKRLDKFLVTFTEVSFKLLFLYYVLVKCYNLRRCKIILFSIFRRYHYDE